MKKNVLKVLFLFVVTALMFAMVACGGDKKTTNNNKKDDDKKQEQEETKKTDAEKLQEALVDIVKTVSPIVKTVSQIQADSTVGVDVGAGGYFKSEDDEGETTTHQVLLSLAGNLSKSDPQVKMAVSYDEKDYFGLGYKSGAAYLLEGLNLINTDAETSQKVKMDLTYLKDGIKNAAKVGMQFLANAVDNDTLKNLDLEAFVIPLLTGEKSSDNDEKGLGLNLTEMLADILTVTTTNNESVIELTKEKFYSPVSSERKNTIIGVLESLKALSIFDFKAVVEDKVDEILADYVSKVFPSFKGETFESLLEAYRPSVKIIAGYTGSGASKKLNQIKVSIATNETKKMEIGVVLNLNLFSITDTADVEFEKGYNAKNLASSVSLKLGNGSTGKLTATINTAEAFANATSPIATAAFNLKRGNKDATVEASYDGRYIKMDATAFNTAYEVVDLAAQTKFYQDLGVTVKGKEDKQNVKEMAKDWLEGLTFQKPEKKTEQKPAENNDSNGEEEESVSAMTAIYNIVAGFIGVAFWADDEADPTIDDIAGIVLVKINPYVSPYLADAIKLVDNKGKALSLKAIGDEFKGVYEDNKTVLEGAVYAAKPEAGAYIWGHNGNHLLKFAGAFAKIPALKGNDEDGYEFDITFTPNDKGGKDVTVNSTVGGEAFTNDFFKHYIEAAFKLDDEDAASGASYADWNAELKNIFGIDNEGFHASILEQVTGYSYATIVDSGILAYASYNEGEGLSGQIGLKSDDKTKTYVELGASVGFVGSSLENVDFAIADGEQFGILNNETGKYEMNEKVFNMIVGLARVAFPVAA